MTDTAAYALEITGDSMLPVYREGDTIIVSPGATLRKGDRVVVKTTDGQVMAKIMQRQTAKNVELASFNVAHDDKDAGHEGCGLDGADYLGEPVSSPANALPIRARVLATP